jgi:hypothetical protein
MTVAQAHEGFQPWEGARTCARDRTTESTVLVSVTFKVTLKDDYKGD